MSPKTAARLALYACHTEHTTSRSSRLWRALVARPTRHWTKSYAAAADASSASWSHRLQLGAVEYVVLQADWDMSHPSLPNLFGQRFMLMSADNRFGCRP